jgi:hypothetical protein
VICPVFCKSDELCEKQTPSETEKSSWLAKLIFRNLIE